jgi:hypothetical protein
MGNSHSLGKQDLKLDERKNSSIETRSANDKDPMEPSKHYSKLDSNDGKGKSKKKERYIDPSKFVIRFIILVQMLMSVVRRQKAWRQECSAMGPQVQLLRLRQ